MVAPCVKRRRIFALREAEEAAARARAEEEAQAHAAADAAARAQAQAEAAAKAEAQAAAEAKAADAAKAKAKAAVKTKAAKREWKPAYYETTTQHLEPKFSVLTLPYHFFETL